MLPSTTETSKLVIRRNVYDYINAQSPHETYSYRAPLTYINQTQALANRHGGIVFSNPDMNGICDGPCLAARSLDRFLICFVVVAGRATTLSIATLKRIFLTGSFRVLQIEIAYHPITSFFHMTEIAKTTPTSRVYKIRLRSLPLGSILVPLRRTVSCPRQV